MSGAVEREYLFITTSNNFLFKKSQLALYSQVLYFSYLVCMIVESIIIETL